MAEKRLQVRFYNYNSWWKPDFWKSGSSRWVQYRAFNFHYLHWFKTWGLLVSRKFKFDILGKNNFVPGHTIWAWKKRQGRREMGFFFIYGLGSGIGPRELSIWVLAGLGQYQTARVILPFLFIRNDKLVHWSVLPHGVVSTSFCYFMLLRTF